MEKLTKREHEILALLAKGFLYKEIADQLGISMSTVRAHLHTVYEKLHVQSRTEAVVKYPGQRLSVKMRLEASASGKNDCILGCNRYIPETCRNAKPFSNSQTAGRWPPWPSAPCLRAAANPRHPTAPTRQDDTSRGLVSLKSPDGSIEFALRGNGPLVYSVAVDGQTVVADSRLGLTFKDGPALGVNPRLIRV